MNNNWNNFSLPLFRSERTLLESENITNVPDPTSSTVSKAFWRARHSAWKMEIPSETLIPTDDHSHSEKMPMDAFPSFETDPSVNIFSNYKIQPFQLV